jgi:hypothetical protein
MAQTESTPAEGSTSYRILPKVGFLNNPAEVAAYRKAREETWFHNALTFAIAQMVMDRDLWARGNELLVAGARLFVDAFYNLDRPDAPRRAAYSPLQEEKDQG